MAVHLGTDSTCLGHLYSVPSQYLQATTHRRKSTPQPSTINSIPKLTSSSNRHPPSNRPSPCQVPGPNPAAGQPPLKRKYTPRSPTIHEAVRNLPIWVSCGEALARRAMPTVFDAFSGTYCFG
ncbi:hypothetical protein CC86DRAFT_61860 [Ophiobolus disseminans]|uniref:Uncharacterized protein n=1 Tax=Ophiobolus disseminans TaxID=1469910 RepID=A0A6A6ZS60_9PLEO|nr:hypothetical protein CC86DRAFT_61860 [Ophiobolus disseminans]